MKNRTESLLFFLCGVGLLVYALFEHYEGTSYKWHLSPALFPVLISLSMMAVSAVLFALEGKKTQKKTRAAESVCPKREKSKAAPLTILLFFAYYLLLKQLSFIPATALFLAAFSYLLGGRSFKLIALSAFAGAVLVYAVFGLALGLRLPKAL